MRIAQLSLLAFGPFRGQEIDFSAPGLHLVFGRNEAGKSTTLRAITGLLYGIPTRTSDAHVHRMTDLRIGGTLTGNDGSRLRVVRRKGTSNTLLDEQGGALDEAALLRMLHGVSEETFRHAFGLDHFTLAEGAKALLDGKGDVGGSLFDASVGGGADVRRLLAELEAEADEIYRPRGANQSLNVALKSYQDLSKQVREKEQLPSSYLDQEAGLVAAQALHRKQTEERAELARRRQRIASARQRVPLERRRAAALKTLSELAAILTNAPRIAELVAGLAGYELTKKASEEEALATERLRGQMADAARRAGAPTTKPDLRIDVRTQSRIQKNVQERTASTLRLATTRVELAKSERELARLHAETPAAATLDDTALATLRRALEQATRLGDGAASLALQRSRSSRKRREVEQRLAGLLPFTGTLEALAALRPPTVAALDALTAKLTDVDKRAARANDRLAQLAADAQRIEQQVAEVSGDFAPPSPAELRAAREARDELLKSVQNAPISSLEYSAIERAVTAADALGDRMIAAADRVLMLSRHEAQRATVAKQTEEVRGEAARLAQQHEQLLAEHAALWSDIGVTASSLADMRAWLGKRDQVLELLASVREAEADAEEAGAALAAAQTALQAALGRDGELATLVDLAKSQIDREESARRTAKSAADGIAKQTAQIEERRASAALDEAALAETKTKLAELLAPLGIDEDADADEVTQALDALKELFSLSDQLAASTERALGQARATAAFEEQAALAARTFAEDLVGLGAASVVRELGSRREQVLAAQLQHEQAEQQLAEMVNADAVSEEVHALASDADAAQRAIDEIDTALADADEQLRATAQDIGGKQAGLEMMRGDSGAADIAAQAQEALARVRSDFERYVRAKAAATLLSREIERYREENQGPLLQTASKLFARLTLGSFEGIRAGFDDKDKPALRCLRPGNAEVDVGGLSEGTRDQLYLSLRLASLLRYAEMAEPMPLVLDDVLIQFDDERSRAALSVIAEVAGRIQVLFFTHHARMIELAKVAVPASSLTVHELGGADVRAGGFAMTAGSPVE